jgi:hypothetical protein
MVETVCSSGRLVKLYQVVRTHTAEQCFDRNRRFKNFRSNIYGIPYWISTMCLEFMIHEDRSDISVYTFRYGSAFV